MQTKVIVIFSYWRLSDLGLVLLCRILGVAKCYWFCVLYACIQT